MFASLFRTQKSASTNRCGSPPRARLGVENLEDRTVPTTLLGNLGPAGDGAQLLGGSPGGVLGDRTQHVSRSASDIRLANYGEENPSLLGGAPGGVLGDRTQHVSVSASDIRLATVGDENPSLLGGAPGGVLGDRTGHVAVSASDIRLANYGEENPSLLGGAPGGVLGDRTQHGSVSANGSRLASVASPKLFGGSAETGGENGSYEPLISRASGEEIPQ